MEKIVRTVSGSQPIAWAEYKWASLFYTHTWVGCSPDITSDTMLNKFPSAGLQKPLGQQYGNVSSTGLAALLVIPSPSQGQLGP